MGLERTGLAVGPEYEWKEDMKRKATLKVVQDGSDFRATVTMGDDGQGTFEQKFEAYAYGYSGMAENRAREVAGILGWEIVE